MSLINDALKRAKQAQGQTPPDNRLGVSLEPVHRAGRSASLPVWIIPMAIVFCLILASAFLYYGWRVSKTDGKGRASVVPVQPTFRSNMQGSAVSNNAIHSIAESVMPRQSGVPPAVKNTTTAPESSAVRIQVNTNLITRTTVVAVAQISALVESNSRNPKVIGAGSGNSVSISRDDQPPVPRTAIAAVKAVTSDVAIHPVRSSDASERLPVASDDLPAVAGAAEGTLWPALKLQGIFLRMTRSSAILNGRTVFVGDSVEGAKVVRIERQALTVELKGATRTIHLQ